MRCTCNIVPCVVCYRARKKNGAPAIEFPGAIGPLKRDEEGRLKPWGDDYVKKQHNKTKNWLIEDGQDGFPVSLVCAFSYPLYSTSLVPFIAILFSFPLV